MPPAPRPGGRAPPHRLASPSEPGSARRRPLFLRTIASSWRQLLRRSFPVKIWRAPTNSRERPEAHHRPIRRFDAPRPAELQSPPAPEAEVAR